MRVLLTTQPMYGHFHSIAPVALALKNHGHEVAFATSESFGPVVKRAGFKHFACGRDVAGSHIMITGLPEWDMIQSKVSHPGLQQIWAFILGMGPQMADDLIRLMQDWRPDIIVRDPVDFGGYAAAECLDVPYASIVWALYISPLEGGIEPLNMLREHCGLSPNPDLTFDPYLVLNALPPAWDMRLGATPPPVVHRFCMPPFDQSVRQDLPEWVHTLPDRPTVYATLGTAFNEQPERFQTLIEAFSAEDFNMIITVGQSMDPAQFRPLPAHIKIERYIPHTLIFPYCDAVVFHGGFNSFHTALWHGLPVVIMPLEAGDQMPTALRCSEMGLGVLVDGNPPEPDAVRVAVKTVLEQGTYRERMQQLRREMMALPDLSAAVKQLEIVASTRTPQLQ